MQSRTLSMLLAGIFGLAIFARLWLLTSIPGGLFPDQAANGEDALAILHGDLQPFYERGNGREALFFYLQAALIALFGIGVWPLFAASALVGIATVGVTYAGGRRLFGPTTGLLAAWILATNPWHVTLSRTGFRAILVPLFIGLTLYFAVGVLQARSPLRRLGQAIGAGMSFGLGWYTYIAYRAFAVVVLVLAAVFGVHDALRTPRLQALRRIGGSVLVAILVATTVASPLAVYFVTHPGSFLGRVGHVSVLNPDLNEGDVVGTVTDVFSTSVLAFFTAGDTNPRHNVPGVPFLSPIPALLALIGILVVLRRVGQYLHRLLHGRRPGYTAPFAALALLLILMLSPAIATAEGIPHGLRSIGEIPAVFWLAGVGGAWVMHWIRRFPSPRAAALGTVVFGILLLLTSASDLALYFGTANTSPTFSREYRADLTQVSAYLSAHARAGNRGTFLALDAFSVQTVHFLTTPTQYPYRRVDPEKSHEVTLAPGEVIVFTASTLPDAERYQDLHPEATAVEEQRNQFGETTMIVFAPGRQP